MRILNWFRDKQQARAASPGEKWPLWMPLVRFSRLPADTWTLADSFQGVAIFGENGSGKTSGSGRVLARKYLGAGLGGMVLCFKTDEADLWRASPLWGGLAGRQCLGMTISDHHWGAQGHAP